MTILGISLVFGRLKGLQSLENCCGIRINWFAIQTELYSLFKWRDYNTSGAGIEQTARAGGPDSKIDVAFSEVGCELRISLEDYNVQVKNPKASEWNVKLASDV